MHNTYWAILLTASFPLLAGEGTTVKQGFYERKAEGWFWYQEQPEEKAPNSPITPVATTHSVTPLSAAWLRENISKYKDAAWNNPTVENAQAFMYLQHYAMDRSQAFAEAIEMAVTGDWYLDETVRRPESSFAAQQVDQQAGAAKQQLLKKLASKLGLFFFFRSNCPYSQLQASILQMLQAHTDFTIVPISLDGGPLATDIFPKYKIDRGHANKLGVKGSPALVLVSEQSEFSPVGYGAMSLQDLEHRLLVAAKRKNWVTAQEYNATRPILNIPAIASENGENRTPSTCTTDQSIPPSSGDQAPLPIAPSELVNRIRRVSQ